MTTASHEPARDPGAAVLGGTFLLTCAASVAVVVVAAIVGGEHAVTAAAVGSVVTLLVMGFGSYVVHVTAKAVPGLSLMVALMTYALQLVVMIAFFSVLAGSGEFGEAVRTPWLVAGVATAVVGWTTAQIRLAGKARVLAYDLPAGVGPEVAAEAVSEAPSRGREASQ